MGLLVNGEWKDQWYDTSKTGGKFVRSKSQFENQIINDENAEFQPETNRYHFTYPMLALGHTEHLYFIN